MQPAAMHLLPQAHATHHSRWCGHPLCRGRACAEFLHVKPGKGAAFVRSKLKNCINGNNLEKTFRAGEMVGVADMTRRDAQYTYAEGDEVSTRARV